jgi:hypothetical protein
MFPGSNAMKHTHLLFGDFYIVDVKYDLETGLASELLICEPRNFHPGIMFWAKREDVISLIEDGYHLELFPPDERPVDKRWFVKVIEIGGKKYMRIDRVAIAADGLTRTEC